MEAPFSVEVSEVFGRCLISLETFNRGDVVWEESPFVMAPSTILGGDDGKQFFTCVSCCKIIEDSEKMVCSVCKWPCCSEECSEGVVHNHLECGLLARLGINVTSSSFDALLHLRIVLSQTMNLESYKIFQTLSSDYYSGDEHQENLNGFQNVVERIWRFLSTECKQRISLSQVSTIVSTCELNSFGFHLKENSRSQVYGRGLYKNCSLLTHGCDNNLQVSFFKAVSNTGDVEWKVRLHARKSIMPGDLLTISYRPTQMILGTVPRQSELFASRQFICQCRRCNDNTEGGTFFQGVVCRRCNKGHLLPMDPIETTISPWKCSNCTFIKNAVDIRQEVAALESLPYTLRNMSKRNANNVALADTFIEANSGVTLHPNHYLIHICAMYWFIHSKFDDVLLTDGKLPDSIMVKIIKRMKRGVPLCMEFNNCTDNSKLNVIVAKAYNAYFLKSNDLNTFDPGQQPPAPIRFRLRICNHVVFHLNESIVWEKMLSFSKSLERLLTLSNFWKEQARDIEEKLENDEEMALTSIQHLFNINF